jgi:hypothetical protein
VQVKATFGILLDRVIGRGLERIFAILLVHSRLFLRIGLLSCEDGTYIFLGFVQ